MHELRHTIPLFVYGTLMRGGRYHERFCGSAVDVRRAAIAGRLYDLEAGYPTLEIPEESVLAFGTGDPIADAMLAHGWPAEQPSQRNVSGQWDTVHGELLTLRDPVRSVPPIDRLEEYEPNEPSLYRRVLALVTCDGCEVAAWLYIGQPELFDVGQRIPSGVWRP